MLFTSNTFPKEKVPLHSLFQSCKNPRLWSERFPSTFCMADDNGVVPPLVHSKDDDVFPLAFLFARKLSPNKQLEGPMLLEKAVNILCDAFDSPDLVTDQLQVFRSNFETISITSSLVRKFDLIGDSYNGVMSTLINELVSSGIEIISEDLSSLQQEKIRSKPMVISPSAYSDFMKCYAMVEKITEVYKNAKKQVTCYFRNHLPSSADLAEDYNFFDLYQTHFNAIYQTMTSILWRTQTAGSRSEVTHSIQEVDPCNDPTEYFFVLTDCIRIASLYFMMASAMNLAVMSIGSLPPDFQSYSLSEETRQKCSLITDSVQFEKIHPWENRNRLMKFFHQKKEVLNGFRKSLEFLFQQVDFSKLVDQFEQKVQEVKHSFKEEDFTSSLLGKMHLANEIVKVGSDLQDVIEKTKQVNQYLEKCFFIKRHSSCCPYVQEDEHTAVASVENKLNDTFEMHRAASRSIESLMALFNKMTDPSSEIFLALRCHPEAFQSNLALLRQRLDIIYKDFMRNISLPMMLETTAFITSISSIDQVYISLCYTTQIVKHTEEFKESRLGKLFLKQKKNSKRYSSYYHKDAQVKVAEMSALKQMREAFVLHGLCYFSITRRKCVVSSSKQELRTRVASHIYRQYRECLLEIFVEFLEYRDKRPIVFFETVLNFCLLLNQNALQTMKTYQAVLHK